MPAKNIKSDLLSGAALANPKQSRLIESLLLYVNISNLRVKRPALYHSAARASDGGGVGGARSVAERN